ncbi:unknown [Bacteroides clarus CAG:160]|nr:unknown [Bacteroides clarus CAG:160]
MLDLSADAASNIQFGADSDTGLANLAVMVGITGIDGSTAGAYLSMEFFGKLEQHVKTFLASHAVASGNHDGSAFQVMFCLFYVAVDDFYHIVRLGHVLGNVVVDDFALIVGVQNLFLHHTFANGCHLRTVLGIHNRGNDVTAECGTDLIQQVLVNLAFLLVFVVADFQ